MSYIQLFIFKLLKPCLTYIKDDYMSNRTIIKRYGMSIETQIRNGRFTKDL